MKQYILVITLIFGCSNLIWSQKSGFYGKKVFVEVTGLGAIPVVNNYQKEFDYYVKSGSTLVSGKDKFNAGFLGALGLALSPSTALSLTAGFSYYNAKGPRTLYFQDPSNDQFYSIDVNHENLQIRSLTIMPIFHFSTHQSSFLPAGFSHEIGVGLVRSKVKEQDYAFTGKFYYNGTYQNAKTFMDSVIATNGSPIDYKQAYRGYLLMYGMKMRTPVSKHLLINYGFRYTFNLTAQNQLFSANSQPSSYETALNYSILFAIRDVRFRSVCSLQLGLTYVF